MILIAHQKRKGPSLAKVDACRLEFVKQCGSIAGPCLAYDIYNILLQGPTLLGQSMFSSVLVYWLTSITYITTCFYETNFTHDAAAGFAGLSDACIGRGRRKKQVSLMKSDHLRDWDHVMRLSNLFLYPGDHPELAAWDCEVGKIHRSVPEICRTACLIRVMKHRLFTIVGQWLGWLLGFLFWAEACWLDFAL